VATVGPAGDSDAGLTTCLGAFAVAWQKAP
jgi:hypothetical protein